MMVELNTLAFKNAKEKDLFVIAVKGKTKYATPISKEELFEIELKRLNEVEKENEKLRKAFEELKQQNENFKTCIQMKFNDFLDIFVNQKEKEKNEENN